MPVGERHLRRMLAELLEHDHGERSHQGPATNVSTVCLRCGAPIGFVVASGSAGSSIVTIARRDEARLTHGT